MTAGTYCIQIVSPAGGYESNMLTLTIENGIPSGVLRDFMGVPLVLRGGSLQGSAVVFDADYGTVCGDYRLRLEATTEDDHRITGRLSFVMGEFPFSGKLAQ